MPDTVSNQRTNPDVVQPFADHIAKQEASNTGATLLDFVSTTWDTIASCPGFNIGYVTVRSGCEPHRAVCSQIQVLMT